MERQQVYSFSWMCPPFWKQKEFPAPHVVELVQLLYNIFQLPLMNASVYHCVELKCSWQVHFKSNSWTKSKLQDHSEKTCMGTLLLACSAPFISMLNPILEQKIKFTRQPCDISQSKIEMIWDNWKYIFHQRQSRSFVVSKIIDFYNCIFIYTIAVIRLKMVYHKKRYENWQSLHPAESKGNAVLSCPIFRRLQHKCLGSCCFNFTKRHWWLTDSKQLERTCNVDLPVK